MNVSVKKRTFVAVAAGLLMVLTGYGEGFKKEIEASFAKEPVSPEVHVYKSTPQGDLRIYHFPAGSLQGKPAVLMIHGGSWQGGSPSIYFRWCRYLAERGIEAFSLEYRLEGNSKTGPDKCLEDAKSAVRWIRENRRELGVDPDWIAVGGDSAGGHLAAALSVVNGFNSPEDDLTVSCQPDLLLLIDPVIDNGVTGYAYDRVKEYWKDFSPVHNLNTNMPLTIGFIGEKDPLISLPAFAAFGKAVLDSGREFRGFVLTGRAHGNAGIPAGQNTTPYLVYMYYEFECFLADHGFLKEQPASLEADARCPVKKISALEYQNYWKVKFSEQ